jgi:hypothetical protein
MQLLIQPGHQNRHTLNLALCVCQIGDETRETVATKLITALSATVKHKAAVALLTTLIAAGALGSGTAAAAASGAFGQQVKAKVESCKAALATGTHGIGECVSDFAQQHGAQQRQQHSQGHPAGSTHNTDTHQNAGHHGGPPSATPGADHGKGHSKP